MSDIIIKGATEGNLKNISLRLPKEKMIVFTGVSGSGKSTLAMDTIYQECQRQYLEAMNFQGIHKPAVESMSNVCAAIQISQNDYHKNPRSTVGTLTNIYTDLRLIYEKLGKRICPHCHREIYASQCVEEIIKQGSDFEVFMYCNYCAQRMKKITRTDFSYNTREGACQTCLGLGQILSVNQAEVIHEELTLEEGAIAYWEQRYGEYQMIIFRKACIHFKMPLPPNTRLCDFTQQQKTLLYYGVNSVEFRAMFPEVEIPKTTTDGRFEGVITTLKRRLSEKGTLTDSLKPYFMEAICPDCDGERLHERSRMITVLETRLPELASFTLEEVYEWICTLEKESSDLEEQLIRPYLLDIQTKVKRILNVGLGYLSLDRQAMSLSGGEAQRMKLSATLDSDLTGILYILDEPTKGLHPKDTKGIIKILKELRDKGNTVLVIEHDLDLMQAADIMVDIGPGSGRYGGEIIGQGTLEEIKHQSTSVTGHYLKKPKLITSMLRKKRGSLVIQNAYLHNLKHIHVEFPLGVFTCVVGVSGSGKSTLLFDVLAKSTDYRSYGCEKVSGLGKCANFVIVPQTSIARMKRSNVATFSTVYSQIRTIFGNLEAAKQHGLTAKHFSFNVKGGRCETCEGLGYIISNMLFFEDVEVPCPTCGGKQFHEDVLNVLFQGYSIKDILNMSIEETSKVFYEYPKVTAILNLLIEVGLGYLELGRSLTTLSGGEGQRLKLARELMQNNPSDVLYLIDEPTAGLHPLDIENFIKLLNRLVDKGNTVIVVEHNEQLIKAADWIIELGVEGGNKGGELIAVGTPEDIINNPASIMGEYLKDMSER